MKEPMRTIQLSVTLPEEIAAKAEKEDSEFISRIVLYGITRRSIYRHLRDQQKEELHG